MPYRDFGLNKDAFIVSSGGGAGAGWTLNSGRSTSGDIYRMLLRFNLNFSDMTDITSAELRMKTASEVGWTYPGTPRAVTRRVKQNWDAGTYGHSGADKITFSSSNAVNWSNQPDQEGTTGPNTALSGGTNVVISIPCTATVKEWAPASVTGGGGKANYGLIVKADDESTSAQRLEVWSNNSGKFDPYIRVYYENNLAPAAPTDLNPGGEAHPVLISPTGTTGTFTGRFIDPDIGDTLYAVNFELHDVASTDEVPIVLSESTHTKAAPGGATLTNNTFSIPKTGLVVATQRRWRARTQDVGNSGNGGKWGPYSPLADGLYRAVAQLNAPTGLSVDIDTAQPFFYGNISGADANAYITAVDFEVLTSPTTGSATPKWVTTPPGSIQPQGIDVGGSLKKFQQLYQGDALSPGLRYQWRVRVRDQYLQWSPFSAFQTWTYLLPTGPATMIPKTNNLVTVTPLLTIGHTAAFDARQLEISASEGGGGTPVYSNAATVASTTSTTHSVPADKLNNGTPYWWRAAIRLTGTGDYGPWSDWYPFRTNTPPLKATIVSPGSRQLSTAQPIGVRRPLYKATYEDPELESDSDYPKKRIISIKRTSDNVVLETNTLNSPPYNVPMSYQGTVDLALETGYYQEWTFEDQLNASSGLSEKFYFRHSTPPVLTFAGPPNPLLDPTPLLSWSATYSGGRSQVAYRILVHQWNPLFTQLLDTGFITGTATTFQMPGGILANSLGTRFEVSVKDQDGNIGTVQRTVTAQFSAPTAPTGFTALPSIGDSSIDLAWVAVASVDSYIIRRKSGSGTAVEIATVLPPEVTYRDFGAPLGVSVEYELTAYNGWAESVPATASAVLETTTPGSSVVNTEDFAIEFSQVTDIPSEYSPIQEIVQPIGRPNPIVEALATGTESGSITVRVPLEDRWQVDALRNLAGAVETRIWVKDRYGATFRVALGNVRRVPSPDAMIELQATWVKVGN